MVVQSVLFDKHLFNQERARHYLKTHHFKDSGVDETLNFYRYRQVEPDPNKKYYIKTLKHGIELVIMY